MRKFASLLFVVLVVTAASATGLDAGQAETAKHGPGQRHDAAQDTLPILGDLFSLHGLLRPDTSWLPFAGLTRRAESVVFVEDIHLEDMKFLYFSGTDVWPHWIFAHAGMLWSPGGLDKDGLTVKILANAGVYRYLSGALDNATVVGRQYAVSALPGWRFKRNGWDLTVLAGLDHYRTVLLPDDPGANLRGSRIGMRAAIEIWHEPSATTMLAADASISSIGAGNYARVAYGWRLFERLYLGPELQYYSSDNYRHARVGIHLTAAKHYEHEWSAAIGFGQDDHSRSGMYLRLGYLTRR